MSWLKVRFRDLDYAVSFFRVHIYKYRMKKHFDQIAKKKNKQTTTHFQYLQIQ